MSLFEKRREISRGELRSAFRKSSGRIPRTGGQKFYRREREKMEREMFGQKYGSRISREDYRKALRDVQSERRKATMTTERIALDKKIRYLRELGGLK